MVDYAKDLIDEELEVLRGELYYPRSSDDQEEGILIDNNTGVILMNDDMFSQDVDIHQQVSLPMMFVDYRQTFGSVVFIFLMGNELREFVVFNDTSLHVTSTYDSFSHSFVKAEEEDLEECYDDKRMGLRPV